MPPASRVKPASGTARTGGPSPARVGKWWGERLASLAPPSLPPQRRRICPRAAARASRPPDCRCEGHHIAAAGICTQSESVSGALEPAGSGGARSARGGKIGGGATRGVPTLRERPLSFAHGVLTPFSPITSPGGRAGPLRLWHTGKRALCSHFLTVGTANFKRSSLAVSCGCINAASWWRRGRRSRTMSTLCKTRSGAVDKRGQGAVRSISGNKERRGR